MKQLGLRGDKFTIRYGVIARHIGKDGSHDLSEKDWERLPKTLQTPFAITKLNNKKDSYRIYTTLQTEKGEYIVVGVEVKNAGRDLEVNAVSTAFGRRADANLPTNEDVIYTDTNITPDQSSLLERPNFAQYPTNQELSADKGSDNVGDVQGLEDYSAEEIKEIAREYIEEEIAENGFDADVVDLAIYGSRRRGDARDDSDLDIVVEYSGNVSEDGLFNALNDAETQLEINGVKVDINPITKGKSGSLNEFMKRAEEYDNDTKYSLRTNSQEVADIVAKAKADGTYMKAPNGESANLTEEQWANVRTKAFKEWFGDWENDPENASKIVDENGEPMVVYHGTEDEFNVFDRTKGRASMDIQGMFFSPWELDAQGYGRNVRAFYLNMRKPSSGGQSYKALNRYQGQGYAGVKARDYLISLGYDGVNNYGEEFIAFIPNQIKSATENVGTYSSEDNDIRYSLRGTTPFYSNAERAVENALEKSGIEVVKVSDAEAQEMLRLGGMEMSAKKKRALKTVSIQENEHQQTAISSADDTKILNNLDNLAKEYDKKTKTEEKTFIGVVADALGIDAQGRSSKYATFETKNGKVVTIRLSNHNATVSNFDNNGEAEGISIVVSAKGSTGISNDGDAHIVEYYYDAIKLRRADGKPLADIVRSIKQALYSGEFKDTTGLAERQEVNFLKTPQGEVYGWTDGKKVYLTEKGMNPETPIHEYTHIWSRAMKEKNAKGWQSVKDFSIQKPIAIFALFAYGDKEKSQNLIVELQKDGKNFLVGVHFNQARNGLEVSSIRGLFPKDSAEWLN